MKPLDEIQPYELQTTPRGKLICPACGHGGYGMYWWSHHRVKKHTLCTGCGRSFVSLSKHLLAGCPGKEIS